MQPPRHIAVIDIGKTNAKLALVDLAALTELAVLTRPNTVLPGPPWPHFDTEAVWAFILAGLADLHASHRVDAITVTTHGAAAAFLGADGGLAVPVLDYEHDYPPDNVAAYAALRPDFAETGSPPLPHGLNLGAQLHYQLVSQPQLRERAAQILTLPQYWAHRLSGVAATEVTSLGAHTDLWCPGEARFSALVDKLGIRHLFAPLRRAGDVLGPVLPSVARATGLDRHTPVGCGLHDSNASLYPHLLTVAPPFSVVSTGTWVIVMTMGGRAVQLDPARDTLININALGEPVISARFMGGREYDLVRPLGLGTATSADIAAVLGAGILLLPAIEPTNGPYQGRQAAWTHPQGTLSPGQREVVVSFYLAMMTAQCLAMTGAVGPVIVEGPFARNAVYLDMLGAACGQEVHPAGSLTGTGIGAALLFAATPPQIAPMVPNAARTDDPALRRYAAMWRAAVG